MHIGICFAVPMLPSGVYKKTYCAFSFFPESCSIVYNCLRNWKFQFMKIETQSTFFLFDVNGMFANSLDGQLTILLVGVIHFFLSTIFFPLQNLSSFLISFMSFMIYLHSSIIHNLLGTFKEIPFK